MLLLIVALVISLDTWRVSEHAPPGGSTVGDLSAPARPVITRSIEWRYTDYLSTNGFNRRVAPLPCSIDLLVLVVAWRHYRPHRPHRLPAPPHYLRNIDNVAEINFAYRCSRKFADSTRAVDRMRVDRCMALLAVVRNIIRVNWTAFEKRNCRPFALRYVSRYRGILWWTSEWEMIIHRERLPRQTALNMKFLS